MKKKLVITLLSLFACLSILTGCNEKNDIAPEQHVNNTDANEDIPDTGRTSNQDSQKKTDDQETDENGIILRVPEKEVDGMIHHAYYEIPLSDNAKDWLDKLIAACETGNGENAGYLCGYLKENEVELISVIEDIKPYIKIISETYEDSDMGLSGRIRFCYKDYRICMSTEDPLYIFTIYMLSDNGMGYVVSMHNYNAYNSAWQYGSCMCSDGMYNGKLSIEEYHYSDNRTEAVTTEINIVNGLRHGEQLTTRHKEFDTHIMDTTETTTFENGKETIGTVSKTIYHFKDGNPDKEKEEIHEIDELIAGTLFWVVEASSGGSPYPY